MSLPEPQFVSRDIATITQEMIAAYEEETGKKLRPAQVERILLDMIAYRETLVRIAMQEAAKQNLLSYARFPMIDYLGELLGVARLDAQPASTTLRFSLAAAIGQSVNIPQGTEARTKDGAVVFATSGSAVIEAGRIFVDVPAAAKTAGIVGNGYLAGEVNALILPIQNIAAVANTSITAGGADQETDDHLRDRIREAPGRFSNAGSVGAYRYWAKTAHQNICDVAVVSPGAGIVNVYPLMTTGNPSQEIIDLVQATLSADSVRPLTDLVQVQSPESVEYSINVELTLYSYAVSPTIVQDAENRLNALAETNAKKLGGGIVPSQIIGALSGIYGLFKVDLNSPEFSSLNAYQWPKCTGVTVTVVGYANG